MRPIKHNNSTLHFYGADTKEQKAYYCANGYTEQTSKLYYRHERTWDDHMGNTPSGYYFNVRWPDGKKQRVCLCDVM